MTMCGTFECRRCGKCCEGRGGIVVGERDLIRLADHFAVAPERFLERYTEMLGGKPCLLTGSDGACLFFKAGFGCTIHPARPDVCRAWPFFRGNLIDSISFEMAREDCPGISRTCGHSRFAHEGYAYLAENGLLGSDPSRDGRALIVSPDELPPEDDAQPAPRGKKHSPGDSPDGGSTAGSNFKHSYPGDNR